MSDTKKPMGSISPVDREVEVFEQMHSELDEMLHDPKKGKDAGELGKPWSKRFISPPFTKDKMRKLI